MIKSSMSLVVAAGLLALTLPAHAQQPQPQAQQNQQQAQQAQLSQQEIREIQTQLRAMGLYQGEVDGIAGPQTQQAVRQFQQQRGLEQTATLDRQSMQQIMGAASSATGTGGGQSGAGVGSGASGQSGQGGTLNQGSAGTSSGGSSTTGNPPSSTQRQ